jgi:hypothetical protein
MHSADRVSVMLLMLFMMCLGGFSYVGSWQEPSWLGWLISGITLTVLFTALAVLEWFGTGLQQFNVNESGSTFDQIFVVRLVYRIFRVTKRPSRFLVYCVFISQFWYVATAAAFFIVVLKAEIGWNALYLLFVLCLYPALLLLGLALYKWRDEKWALPPSKFVKYCICYSQCVVLTFLVLLEIYFGETGKVVGSCLLGSWLIFLYTVWLTITWVNNDYYLSPRLRKSIVFVLAVLVVAGVAFGLFTSNPAKGFVGFSVSWFCVMLGLLLYCVAAVYGQRNVQTRPGSHVFPAYFWNEQSQCIVQSNAITILTFADSICGLIWGISAVVFYAPIYIGLAGISISAAVFFIYCLHILRKPLLLFIEAENVLADAQPDSNSHPQSEEKAQDVWLATLTGAVKVAQTELLWNCRDAATEQTEENKTLRKRFVGNFNALKERAKSSMQIALKKANALRKRSKSQDTQRGNGAEGGTKEVLASEDIATTAKELQLEDNSEFEDDSEVLSEHTSHNWTAWVLQLRRDLEKEITPLVKAAPTNDSLSVKLEELIRIDTLLASSYEEEERFVVRLQLNFALTAARAGGVAEVKFQHFLRWIGELHEGLGKEKGTEHTNSSNSDSSNGNSNGSSNSDPIALQKHLIVQAEQDVILRVSEHRAKIHAMRISELLSLLSQTESGQVTLRSAQKWPDSIRSNLTELQSMFKVEMYHRESLKHERKKLEDMEREARRRRLAEDRILQTEAAERRQRQQEEERGRNKQQEEKENQRLRDKAERERMTAEQERERREKESERITQELQRQELEAAQRRALEEERHQLERRTQEAREKELERQRQEQERLQRQRQQQQENERTAHFDQNGSESAVIQKYLQANANNSIDSTLFEDKEFEGTIALGSQKWVKDEGHKQVTWKRPHEWTTRNGQQAVMGTVEASDMMQGSLGDCWFLSAIAVCAHRDEQQLLLNKNRGSGLEGGFLHKVLGIDILTDDTSSSSTITNTSIASSSNSSSYSRTITTCSSNNGDSTSSAEVLSKSGAYILRFFQDGVWTPVIIDDRIPCQDRGPCFASSAQRNEIWIPLLEKAYAKRFGSYEALEGGHVSDALADLTGGHASHIDLSTEETQAMIANGSLWQILVKSVKDGNLLGAGSHSGTDNDEGADANKGIVQGHAYSIFQLVEEEDGHGNTAKLVQLKNPWGRREWTGAWSDFDKTRWTRRMRTKLKFSKKDDGLFWMSFDDFVYHFCTVYMCRIFSGSDWHSRKLEGEWKGTSAAGCSNYHKVGLNPQYQLVVTKKTNVVVTLTQKNVLGRSRDWDCMNLAILNLNGAKLNRGHFRRREKVACAGSYADFREVHVEVAGLEPGKYTLLPSLYDPGVERGFVIEVFSKRPVVLLPL